MTSANPVLRFLLLPQDLLFFTRDFFRILFWLIRRLFAWIISGRRLTAKQILAPCFSADRATTEIGNQPLPVCHFARKYANPFFIGLLCPALRTRTGTKGFSCGCTVARSFKLSIGRYAASGTLLLVAWAALAVAIYLAVHAVAGDRLDRFVNRHFRSQSGTTRTTRGGKVTKSTARAQEFIERAKRLADEKKYAAARIEYKNALQYDPTSIEALLGIGKAARELDFIGEAMRAFEDALKTDPSCANAHINLAELARGMFDLDRALSHARKARELKPSDPEAAILLASCLHDKGELEPALAEAKAAVLLAPANPKAYTTVANIEMSRGNLDEAQRLFKKALEIDTSFSDAHLGMAAVYQARGDKPGAINQLTGGLKHDPDNQRLIMVLADLYASEGDFRNATKLCKDAADRRPDFYTLRNRLAAYEIAGGNLNEGYNLASKILKDKPGDVSAHLILADLFLRQGFPSLAVEHCRQALENNAYLVTATRLLGRALLEEGSYQEAAKVLEPLVKALPNDMEGQLLRSLSLGLTKKYDQAESALKKLSEAHPESALPYVQLGQLYPHLNKIGAAISNYRKALEMDPDNVTALNNLAALLLEQEGDHATEAFDMAMRAWRKSPADAAVSDTLGWAYFHKKEYTEAIDLLTYATYQMPRQPTVRYHLGSAFLAAGKKEEAKKQFEAALLISPTFAEADKVKALLKEMAGK